jgi:3-hydroxybutyryl-CoA dehydratase
VNVEVAPVVREITQMRIHAYADASGDHNPIHIDEDFARTTPLGGTIAHGMLVLALISEMMQSTFGKAWTETGTLKVRFKAPTRPGDTVTASATFLRASGGIAEYAVQCETPSGGVVIEGRASVTVVG